MADELERLGYSDLPAKWTAKALLLGYVLGRGGVGAMTEAEIRQKVGMFFPRRKKNDAST